MNAIQLIAIVCGFFLFIALLIILLQHHLAKNHQTSSLYWRNSLILSDLVFELAHHRIIDSFINVLRIYFAACFNFSQFIVSFAHVFMMHDLKTTFDALDDGIDDAAVTDVLALGKATLGPKLSPFLYRLMDKDVLHTLDQFVIKGIITEPELYSFCNLLANKLHRQAELTLAYQLEVDKGKKSLHREQIAQHNIEISGVYLALIIHFVKKDKRIHDIVSKKQNNQLTYDHLKAIYATETQVGELMQISHDILEFRYDLRQESRLGKITPNYFLAQLEKNSLLLNAMEQIRVLPDRPVTVFELPNSVREHFLSIESSLNTQSFAIGKMTGLVFLLLRQYETRLGFYAEKPNHLWLPVWPFVVRKKVEVH